MTKIQTQLKALDESIPGGITFLTGKHIDEMFPGYDAQKLVYELTEYQLNHPGGVYVKRSGANLEYTFDRQVINQMSNVSKRDA